VNLKRWISSVLCLLKIHSANCEHSLAHETRWDDKVKRLKELNGSAQQLSSKDPNQGTKSHQHSDKVLTIPDNEKKSRKRS
jgi:hypothetical protein